MTEPTWLAKTFTFLRILSKFQCEILSSRRTAFKSRSPFAGSIPFFSVCLTPFAVKPLRTPDLSTREVDARDKRVTLVSIARSLAIWNEYQVGSLLHFVDVSVCHRDKVVRKDVYYYFYRGMTKSLSSLFEMENIWRQHSDLVHF